MSRFKKVYKAIFVLVMSCTTIIELLIIIEWTSRLRAHYGIDSIVPTANVRCLVGGLASSMQGEGLLWVAFRRVVLNTLRKSEWLIIGARLPVLKGFCCTAMYSTRH